VMQWVTLCCRVLQSVVAVCCNELQRVAAYCSVLQRSKQFDCRDTIYTEGGGPVCYSLWQLFAFECSVSWFIAVHHSVFSVVQCVPVCCSVWQSRLQWIVVCHSVLQYIAVWCSVVQCGAVCCSVLQCVAVWCSVVQCGAVWCSVVQCVAVCCYIVDLSAHRH